MSCPIMTLVIIFLSGCTALYMPNTVKDAPTETKPYVKWVLEVNYPDNEKKLYNLPDEDFQLKLPTSSWKCAVTRLPNEAEQNKVYSKYGLSKDLSFRAVACFKGEDSMSTLTVCGKEYPTNSTFLAIGEKSKDHRIHLTCTVR